MKRFGTGLAIGVAWLFLLLHGSAVALWIVAILAAALMLREYHSMVHGHETASVDRLLGIGLGLFPVAAALSGHPEHVSASLYLAIFLLFLLTIVTSDRHPSPFLFLAKTGFGIFYIGFFCAHLVLLRSLENGGIWLLYVSALTVAADTGAYFVGTAIGRNKLCPLVSPGKTFEGLAGGLASAAAVGGLFSIPSLLGRPARVIVPLSIVLAVAGVVGDLGESLLKRSCKVKDSGVILPGHGGLLDRVDALLLAMPALYYLLRFGVLR